VLFPNKLYSGQKFINAVKSKTIATTGKTHENSPVTTLKKSNAAMNKARTIRTILSVFPMFFFLIYIG
jgi:hypothetical protein